MIKSKKITNSKPATNSDKSYIEAFLFYANPEKTTKKDLANGTLEALGKLDTILNNCVVFLNLKSALQYSRFMNTNHVILRVYVSEVAIEGHNFGLVIRKGFLSKAQIHGYFPGWEKGKLYLENPGFDDRYENKAMEQMVW